jgi:hypothetical protein
MTDKPITRAVHAREDDYMQATNIINTTTPAVEQSKPQMTQRLSNTTYEVYLHYSTTSKETLTDKVMRLIRNDISNSNVF